MSGVGRARAAALPWLALIICAGGCASSGGSNANSASPGGSGTAGASGSAGSSGTTGSPGSAGDTVIGAGSAGASGTAGATGSAGAGTAGADGMQPGQDAGVDGGSAGAMAGTAGTTGGTAGVGGGCNVMVTLSAKGQASGPLVAGPSAVGALTASVVGYSGTAKWTWVIQLVAGGLSTAVTATATNDSGSTAEIPLQTPGRRRFLSRSARRRRRPISSA
jgi:pilus assembly protein FimV